MQTKPFSLPSATNIGFMSFCGLQSARDFVAHSCSFVPLEYTFCHLNYSAIEEINYYNELWG